MKLTADPSGAVVLVSEALEAAGVPHAFSTRKGGVSVGAFESLNFGNPAELAGPQRDPAANIQENYRRLLEAAKCPGREVIETHQVHGSKVHLVAPGEAGSSNGTGPGARVPPKADGMVTGDRGHVLAVRTADCAPVLLASADGSLVAAVHAGWRGVLAGVVPQALAALRALGAEKLIAAIGPCIGATTFEVGPEVAEEFRKLFGAAGPVRPAPAGKFLVDLPTALARQLGDGGLDRVDWCERCTVTEPEFFFSHRRDRGITGRMASVISPR